MSGWIKYLRGVRVETEALMRNNDLASTRTLHSLVRDEGVAGSNPATPTNFPRSRIHHGERYGEILSGRDVSRSGHHSRFVVADEGIARVVGA
jgi:hypothetical protein